MMKVQNINCLKIADIALKFFWREEVEIVLSLQNIDAIQVKDIQDIQIQYLPSIHIHHEYKM